MEQAEPSKEKTELIKETKLLEDFPVEVLVRIFNFLPNHNIRCGVSMACKKFQKICQDEFLVPVKDLCIKGHYFKYWSGGKQVYGLRNIGNVIDVIVQSKYLTTLKIKALNYETIYHLVSTALEVCPKLFHLEIVDTFAQYVEPDDEGNIPEFEQIFESISTFGNALSVINLKLSLSVKEYDDGQDFNFYFDWILEDYIAKGCPKLRSLSLETLDLSGEVPLIEICVFGGLESLSKGCKELNNLKLTNIRIGDDESITKSEIMEMFSNCNNMEFKNCITYHPWTWLTDSLSNEIIPFEDFDFLDLEGGEIEFMFTQNYGEE